jgi:tRNA pseudouridine38-40 synthase
MPTFQLTIAYDGTAYCGWQSQVGHDTVQGRLERALVKFTKRRIPITGSSRTDAGVHALGQVASLSIDDWRAGSDALLRAINSRLPHDILVRECREVADSFHAINDSIGKRYRYQLQCGGQRQPFAQRYHWQVHRRLDLAAMQEAAKGLVGTHDFASFEGMGSKRKSSVRTITDLWIDEGPNSPELAMGLSVGRDLVADEPSQWLHLEVAADGFLYNMVRNIVGTLVLVGRGDRSIQWVDWVLRAADRSKAGQTAPPQGLFLVEVHYPPVTSAPSAEVDCT